MQINTILFDLDGTLIDPWEGIFHSVEYTLQKMGCPVPQAQDLLWIIGPPIRDNMGKLLNTDDPVTINRSIELFRERFGTLGLYENTLYDGVVEMLSSLKKQGINTYIATSKPQAYAFRILERHGLTHFFNSIYGSEMDGTHSDKVELIAYILEKEKFPPQHALMIGDRMFDIAGGKQNGLFAGGVTYGYGNEEELKVHGADILFHKPQDIMTLINGN